MGAVHYIFFPLLGGLATQNGRHTAHHSLLAAMDPQSEHL
jgi:hypothetical protein